MERREEGADVILSNFTIDLKGSNVASSSNSDGMKRLLHPVNARIEGGKLFGILGGSGSGKVINSIFSNVT